MRTLAHNTILILGIGFLLATTAVFGWTFLLAYSVPAKAVIIHIDKYHEATIELIMFIVLFPISLMASYLALKYEN